MWIGAVNDERQIAAETPHLRFECDDSHLADNR